MPLDKSNSVKHEKQTLKNVFCERSLSLYYSPKFQ